MLLPVVLICGCTTTSTREYRAREEERIREVVLLERLALRDTNRVVFVSFEDSARNFIDPSDAVIARIRAAGIPARKASEAGRDGQTYVVDKASGEVGVIYYAGALRWLSDSKVEVIEGSTCASLCGGFTEFIMTKKDGKWIRTRTKRMVAI
jgi:hypothetical protein